MSDNEQELLKLETEIYHSDGGIYFAECDTASTRDEIAQRLGNRFLNKNVKVIKINVRVPGVASTRAEMVRRLEDASLDKDVGIAELDVHANDLTYAVTRYHGGDAAFFVYLPSEKPELEDLARILNYTRDEFAKIKQPIIIWADKVSLGIIARSAPDFWAWKARVSEFKGVSDGLGYGGEVEVVETIWKEKVSDEEIQAYERALAEFQERGDEKEAAKVLGQLGILHYRRGEWDLAIEYYEKDMEIFEALGDRHGLGATYNNLGLVYADKGEWDIAIKYYEKDMEISEALGNRHGLAKTYGNLGNVYYRKGERDRAIEYHEKSMKIKEALGDRHGLAQTYNNLGSVYYRKCEWDIAIKYYEKSMEILKDLGDRHGLAQTYNNLGLVYADKGEWDIAIKYYEKDMEISEALGDRYGIAKTYGNLGLVYADKGEWDIAIKYYEKDMEISEALGNRHGLAKTYGNLGNVYAKKGEWDLAIEYYEKDMEIFEALGDRHGLAHTYNNLGTVYADKGEWDLAIEYYEKSMKIKEALGDRHGVGTTLANIGKTYLDPNPASAKRNLEEAVKKIHPDARPEYPNALNWLAVSLRMIADQKKREAKLATSDVERETLVTAAAELYREAAERYEEAHGLPLARMPDSLLMDAHITRGLSYSAQNITEEDADKAIELLDRAIAEMEAALEFADGADVIRLGGAIASHRAKRCVREIELHRDDAKKRDELLDLAISHLAEAAESFGSLGDAGACSSKTCDGCRHLYTALGLIHDGFREQSNRAIMDAVSEIRSAEQCYESVSNEIGMDVADRIDKILNRTTTNLENLEGFKPGQAYSATKDFLEVIDEISGVGLRNMIKILVFDEAGNVTERQIPTMALSGGDSARGGGVILSGEIGDNATINIDTGRDSPPKKRKTVSLWDYVLGAVSSILTGIIAAILMSLYFEEPIENFRIPAGVICVIMLLIIIYARYRISKSKT